MIITIDGPAGVGKSSVAKMIAQELGFNYLDTGAMYRAITWSVLRQGVDPKDAEAAYAAAEKIEIRFEDEKVIVDRHDVTLSIRNNDVTQSVSPIADNPRIRERLVELQREIAKNGNYICEGRDQGTVVFPNAICKIFLVATAEERATRRVRQLNEQGHEADFEEILQMQNERDEQDYNRPIGRLLKADDAVEVITDNNTLDEIATLLIDIIRQKVTAVDSTNP
jgi:cytidylate kinase